MREQGDFLGKVYFVVFLSILVWHMTLLLLSWESIPSEIGIHYTDGKPDGFGPKYVLFLLPFISLITWVSLGFAKRHPDKLNYLNLTEHNKETQYVKGKQMMAHVQFFTALSIIFMNEAFLKEALGEDHAIQLTIAVILIGICVLIPFSYMVWSVRLKDSR